MDSQARSGPAGDILTPIDGPPRNVFVFSHGDPPWGGRRYGFD